MFCSSGILKYSDNPIKLIVEADNEIAKYYRSVIPKYIKINVPKYPAHISVVRNAIPPNIEYWNKLQNTEIFFEYESKIYNDQKYYWLNVWSKTLENIREELGLKPWGDVSMSPDFKHRFHITIANLK